MPPGIILKESGENDHLYIDTARHILTYEWIERQLKIMYEQSQFKEKSYFLDLLHPFIKDYLNVLIALREAATLKHDLICMGLGYHNTIELGRNLYELHGLYREDKIRPRLQDKNLYDDVCWELEVAMCLKYTGFEVRFEKEINEKMHDISAIKEGDAIAIECKNKHIVDDKYNDNKAFAVCLADKLLDKLNEIKDSYDLRITIRDKGKIEDIKDIAVVVQNMLKSGNTVAIFNNNYRIEIIDEYKNISTALIMQQAIEELCINSRDIKSLKDIYSKKGKTGTEYRHRLFFRFPPEDLQLRNLNNLIKNANKQIKGIQGCVFLKVPSFQFDNSVEEVRDLFSKGRYSNIGAVKLVSLNKTFHAGLGVKIERKEAIIVNQNAIIPISHSILDTLSKNIIFNKYKRI